MIFIFTNFHIICARRPPRTKFSLTSTGLTKQGFAVLGKPGELIQPFFWKSAFPFSLELSVLFLHLCRLWFYHCATVTGTGSRNSSSITATSFRRGLGHPLLEGQYYFVWHLDLFYKWANVLGATGYLVKTLCIIIWLTPTVSDPEVGE